MVIIAPLWKIHLYQRDSYCCQKCGSSVDLSVHHLFPKSKYPELKMNRANLITLCQTCHQHYHNWHCKRDIEKCNPITFLEWIGEEYVQKDYSQDMKFIVRIDKRYKEHFNRIWKEVDDE